MKKILIFIALAGMIWSACSQADLPDDGSDVPVFFIELEGVDTSTSTSLTAGLGSTYLFTRVERGANGVLEMSGAFAAANCPTGDCLGSVRFDFRNSNSGNTAEAGAIFQEDADWKYRSDSSLDSLQYQTVAIKWVRPDGNVFRSDVFPQSTDSSYFHILKSEPWELNERGETTWKMNVEFACWMFDSIQGQESRFTGNGVIAVGYR